MPLCTIARPPAVFCAAARFSPFAFGTKRRLPTPPPADDKCVMRHNIDLSSFLTSLDGTGASSVCISASLHPNTNLFIPTLASPSSRKSSWPSFRNRPILIRRSCNNGIRVCTVPSRPPATCPLPATRYPLSAIRFALCTITTSPPPHAMHCTMTATHLPCSPRYEHAWANSHLPRVQQVS